jgi:GT2 family glycosyltransferase
VSAPAARRPRVAIIVLQWRRAEETVGCLRSLAALDYPDHHVLVVDNHSADGSVEVLRREFPAVDIRENAENLGFAGGCNAGIRAALADPEVRYVLLLNNDTRVARDLVTQMVAAAEADPTAVVVGAVNASGDGYTSSGGWVRWWTGRYADVFDQRTAAEVCREPAIEVDTVAGSSMLVRAEPLRAGVLLDAAFFCVFEETDWCLRLRARGGRVLLATRARLEHRISTTMGKPLQLYFRFRNRPYFMRKHARPIHWVTFVPYYLAEAAVRIVMYTLAGRGKDARGVLLGVWDGARSVRGPGRLEELVG